MNIEALVAFIQKWRWLIEVPVIDLAILPEKDQICDQINSYHLATLKAEISQISLISSLASCPMERCKKEHEIKVLSDFIELVVRETAVENLVDVGCGNGYLEELLVKIPSVKSIVGIDCSLDQVEVSQRKNNNGKCTFLRESFSRNTEIDHSFGAYGLVSLHGCGNLWHEMIMHWSCRESCRFVVAVPCCYNLMSPETLPLSRRAKELQAGEALFSSKMLMLACQRPESQSAMSNSIKSVLFRTILQRALADNGFMQVKVGRVKVKEQTTLEEYFAKALGKINIQINLDMQVYNDLACELFPIVAKLWEMRAWIGTIAESLIVADRCEFLSEMQQLFPFRFQLKNLFDRRLSARNICIVCVKEELVEANEF